MVHFGSARAHLPFEGRHAVSSVSSDRKQRIWARPVSTSEQIRGGESLEVPDSADRGRGGCSKRH
eukprot:3811135-Rhodomonas_salina.1